MNIRDLMNKLDGIAEATTDFANPGTGPATTVSPKVDPAKAHAYRRAQQAMANLEKAAQYTGSDEIIRQRAGLPPQLPPVDQWDGTMPKPIGRPDWFNRWFGTGGGLTGDVEQDQTQASAQNDTDASTIQTAFGQLKQLQDLVGKLATAQPPKPVVKPAPDTGTTSGQSASTQGTTTAPTGPVNRDSMTFSQAFADARKKGEKTFTWKGKSYNTDVAGNKQTPAASTTGTTTPGFASNGGGAAFGNPNITKQGQKEGAEFDIASQLVESFGYQVKEGLAADMGQMAAGGVAGGLAGKAAAKMGARFIPGVATGMDAVDAVQRVRDKDYVGAGISAAGALGGLVPGIGGVLSGGAAGINLGRDLAHTYKAGQAPDLKQMQKELGVNPDGVVGPQTIKALKMNPKVGAKYGFGPDGQPMKKQESVAEGIASLRDRLAMIESDVSEANYGLAAKTAAASAADIVDVAPKVIRQGEKFMGMAQEVPKTGIGHTAQAAATDVAPAVSKVDKAKNAAKTGANWAKENPGKSTLGAAAAGAALGYGLTGGKPTPGPNPGPNVHTGGDTQTPDASDVGDTVPSFDPAVIGQIDELMSALAQVNDDEIQQGLEQVRAQVNKLTGGKPLTDFVAK